MRCDSRPHPGEPGHGIRIGMPRSAAQSDFVVESAPVELVMVEGPIGDGTEPVELPRMEWRTTEASSRATRVVMTFTFIVLAALAVLALVAPHIPSGE
jgi:hypothetical protein